MKLIIGLGNPGEQYIHTRHNVGFMTLDALAKEQSVTWQFNKKYKAEIAKVDDTLLVKPQTFMNNSGQVVQAVISYYKLLPKKLGIMTKKDTDLNSVLTIIHDDIDIELGKYKISSDSRSAGHKGVQSIINHLKTKNFKRIRIGIRTDSGEKMPTEKFVLQKFNSEEINIIKNLIPEIISETKKASDIL